VVPIMPCLALGSMEPYVIQKTKLRKAMNIGRSRLVVFIHVLLFVGPVVAFSALILV
jgi:hypothetical protein